MRKKELYFELTKQAFDEKLPRLGPGVMDASPNNFGKAMGRFTELCQDAGICEKCAWELDECKCDELGW